MKPGTELMPPNEQISKIRTGQPMVHFNTDLSCNRSWLIISTVCSKIRNSLFGEICLHNKNKACHEYTSCSEQIHIPKKTSAQPCMSLSLSLPVPLTFLLFWDGKHSDHSLWMFPCGWWTQTAHTLFSKYKWERKSSIANSAIGIWGKFFSF